jgi:hypothetical protein
MLGKGDAKQNIFSRRPEAGCSTSEQLDEKICAISSSWIL